MSPLKPFEVHARDGRVYVVYAANAPEAQRCAVDHAIDVVKIVVLTGKEATACHG